MLDVLCTRPSLRRGVVIRHKVKPRHTGAFIACYFRLYFSDKDRLTRLTSKE